jgi:hypothetical protein
MFVGTGTLRKPEEYEEARRLRGVVGMPMKRIATKLGVSPGTVHAWTKDIELTPEQRRKNRPGQPHWVLTEGRARKARDLRRQAQEEGRLRAREGETLHQAGCMLFWAEGSKARNEAVFCNSDANMVSFVRRFFSECFELPPDRFSVRLNVYTGNGLTLRPIEDHWLWALELPRSCLRKHCLNHFPTSSSGSKRNKLPYGVCTLRVLKSTHIVQHIYGAIQEYAGFEQPRWLDGPKKKSYPRKPQPDR